MVNIIEELKKVPKDKLIETLALLTEQSPENSKLVKMEIASDDLVEITRLLLKEVSALSKTAKSYHFKDSMRVANIIDGIASKVEKYLVLNSPDNAIKVLKKLIALDVKLFDHVDDSYACMSGEYNYAYEILDRAFANSDESPKEIAKYIIEACIDNDYGVRDGLLNNINKCLQGEKALMLEEAINDYTMKAYLKQAILKKVADLTQDVDKYIEAINDTHPSSILEIAERLLAVKRPEEAITWLLKIEGAWDAKKLLAAAYHQSGDKGKAQEIRWDIFKTFCSISSYESYIEYSPKSEHATIEAKAIELAKNTLCLEHGVLFLKDIKRYDILEKLLLRRYDEVNDNDYTTYRPIAIVFAEQGKYLVASLLRRKLAQGCIAKANTKYYKCVADDYKFCNDYADKVKSWGEFQAHQQFISNFKEAHKRKTSFWALIS